MTMRGGDRPKGAHDEFSGVSVMPRSMWEPWLVFRKPLEGRVQDNLRKWRTGGIQATLSSTSLRGRHPLVADPEGGAGSGAASEPEAAGIPPAIGQRGAAARRGHHSRSVLRRGLDACRGGGGGLPERRYRERFGVLRHGVPRYSSTEKLPAGAGRHVSDSVDPVLPELPDAVAMQRGGTRPQLSAGIAPVESGIRAAGASGDAQHEVDLRWLHATARIMVTNSLWWAMRTVSSKTSDFVRSLIHRERQAIVRAQLLAAAHLALLEQGLLDHVTIVERGRHAGFGRQDVARAVPHPAVRSTSSRPTGDGWSTSLRHRALSFADHAAHARGLRADRAANVEQLDRVPSRWTRSTGTVLLTDRDEPFDILGATSEKLSLVIRSRKVDRPLALVAMDEAQNLESEGRGLTDRYCCWRRSSETARRRTSCA